MRRLSAAQKTEYVQNKNYILKKRDAIAIIRNGVTLFVISMKANDKNSHCQSFFLHLEYQKLHLEHKIFEM